MSTEEDSSGAYEEMPPPGADAQGPMQQIEQLIELREQGILTEEEFRAEEQKLLGN